MWIKPRRREDPMVRRTSAPLPKFVIHRSAPGHELRKQRGTSKFMILVPLFDLKFLNEPRRDCCRNFKSAALATKQVLYTGLCTRGTMRGRRRTGYPEQVKARRRKGVMNRPALSTLLTLVFLAALGH